MKVDFGKCLILSPHYDDWFFGCWSIVRRAQGAILIYSSGAAIGDPDEEQRKTEIVEARKIIPEKWAVDEKQMFAARQFFRSYDLVEDAIYKAVDAHRPETILMIGGRHRDHREVRDAAECVAENYELNSMVYYVNLNSLTPPPNVCVELTLEEAELKWKYTRDLWKSQGNRVQHLQHERTELFRWIDGSW